MRVKQLLAALGVVVVSLATGVLEPGTKPAAATGVVAVAAGAGGEVRAYSCVLTGAGAVTCWGSTPTSDQPAGLESGIVAVATGSAHACVLTVAGTVRCWGDNSYGQLGDGTTARRPGLVDVLTAPGGPPLGNAVAISAGGYHTCALMRDGELLCWGRNDDGQVSRDGIGSPRPSPVPVSLGDWRFATVSAGGFHTCALTRTGLAMCWGSDRFGELGNGPEVRGLGWPFGESTGITAVAAGGAHSCALTTAGGVMCWGKNIGTSPVSVSGLNSGVAAVATGGIHSCALTSAGGVKCWGENFEGQLGDGTTKDSILSPVDVVGLSSGVRAIGAGGYHTCAVTNEGAVKCWGMAGSNTRHTTPVDVPFDSDRDGCLDSREQGVDATQGGLRNPKSFWDFFDTPSPARDRRVTVADIAAVVARFGSTGDPAIDPLSDPPAAPAYHAAFDRSLAGPERWRTGPPDGRVTVQDIALIVAQFGHTCA